MMLRPDKVKHMVIGLLMGICFFAGAVYFLRWPTWQMALGSLLLVTAIGYGFELFSKITGRGHYELLDAIVTAIGGAAGTIIAWLLMANY